MDSSSYQPWLYNATPYQYQQYQYSQVCSSRLNQQPCESLPPWRSIPPTMPNTRSQNRQARQVDQWRSYSADANNLQSATTTTGYLNATAPVFEPTTTRSSNSIQYRPYESLRVSNGNAERKVVEANNATQNQKKSKHKNKKGSASSIPQSIQGQSKAPNTSKQTAADFPLPSIEVSEVIGSKISPVSLPLRPITPRKTRTKSPEAPVASRDYCYEAEKAPSRLNEPQRLLVILDLNGTLLYRNRAAGAVHVRPGVTPFVDYLFDNHIVMVYTSATPEKAQAMVNSFLHPAHRNKLAAVWARDMLGLTPVQYRNKVQVYKKLDKIWNNAAIQTTAQAGQRWNQSNTILIDDSHLKALAQPFNLIQVPEYAPLHDPRKAVGKGAQDRAYKVQLDIMQQLQSKIEELRYQNNVSRLIRRWQTGEVGVPKAPDQEVTVEENVDQRLSTKVTQADRVVRPHLPTPDSLTDEVGSGVEVASVLAGNVTSKRRSGSESSIEESVFRELLGGTDK